MGETSAWRALDALFWPILPCSRGAHIKPALNEMKKRVDEMKKRRAGLSELGSRRQPSKKERPQGARGQAEAAARAPIPQPPPILDARWPLAHNQRRASFITAGRHHHQHGRPSVATPHAPDALGSGDGDPRVHMLGCRRLEAGGALGGLPPAFEHGQFRI